jgi:hypothetical protein
VMDTSRKCWVSSESSSFFSEPSSLFELLVKRGRPLFDNKKRHPAARWTPEIRPGFTPILPAELDVVCHLADTRSAPARQRLWMHRPGVPREGEVAQKRLPHNL